ncbi:hypothetical protein ABEG17_10820 [Pedococcus sp. KACC 23699]|uniref:Fibronectin type-III domain-containing protein n=1 Tax=Pedococcus sp. KACC 23699 TaxID=3149228 RepID=A0AAU7JQA3_9MICO
MLSGYVPFILARRPSRARETTLPAHHGARAPSGARGADRRDSMFSKPDHPNTSPHVRRRMAAACAALVSVTVWAGIAAADPAAADGAAASASIPVSAPVPGVAPAAPAPATATAPTPAPQATTAAATPRAANAVASAPVVTTQPVETWVDLGSSATFTAHASGTPAPTVQWQFRRWYEDPWTDVPGATSDRYTTPPSSVNDVEPGYRAVFTNSAGSVTTAAVDLRINQPAPPAGTPSAPRDVTAHQTAKGQVTITWSAPADSGTSPITSYGAGYGTRRWGNGDTYPATTFHAVFNDIADGDYTAVVFANNDVGMGWRVSVPVSVGDLSTAPTHLTATLSGTTGTVTWGAPTNAGYSSVTGYEVLATSGSHRVSRSVSAATRRVALPALTSGVWHVTVRATNTVGIGAAAATSLTVTTTATAPTPPPPAPTTPVPTTPATRPSTTPVAAAPARPAAAASTRPAASLAPAASVVPTRAVLAHTGSNGSSQALLALALMVIGVGCAVGSRRMGRAG